MKLFNNNGEGAREIWNALGLIADDITFDKWSPLLPLGMRDLSAIIGEDALSGIVQVYENGPQTDGEEHIVYIAQQSVAYFTWLKVIPTLDAQHGDTGRAARLGENEKGLSALQEYKDEENILRLAYEFADHLIMEMEREEFEPWMNSEKRSSAAELLLRSKQEFDLYYFIGSHRLYFTLIPIIREVQETEVLPVVGTRFMKEMIAEPRGEISKVLRSTASRAVALLAMKKAVERLPVEVIPEGVVQVQQQQTVKQRLKAEQSTRKAVAESLGADAQRCLSTLQALVAQLDHVEEEVDDTITTPIVHSKGITF